MNQRDATVERRVLVLGVPRSGTSWVSRILAGAPDSSYAFEPDNEKTALPGRCLKRRLPRFPTLSPGETDPEYERLWRFAFGHRLAPRLCSGRLAPLWRRDQPRLERWVRAKDRALAAGRDPRGDTGPADRLARLALRTLERLPGGTAGGPRIVKSVHGVLAAEWVADAGRADAVVVVLRSPYAVLASQRRLEMPDAVRPAAVTPAVQERILGRVLEPEPERLTGFAGPVLQLAIMYRALEGALDRQPDWIEIRHEELCLDPPARFRALFDRLGLAWTRQAADRIDRLNRGGSSYRPQRVARNEIGKWRRELTDREIAEIGDLLATYGLEPWIASESEPAGEPEPPREPGAPGEPEARPGSEAPAER